MGAATRVEEAIAHSERQRFDLAALVRAAVDAYGGAFPQRRFACEVPADPVEMTGAPELIVQMLDKLVDNAVDFSADGATITIVLRAERSRMPSCPWPTPGRRCRPRRPPGCSSRCGSRARKPTSGRISASGLYIVRLIAEFHGGIGPGRQPPRRLRRGLHRPSDALSAISRTSHIQPTQGLPINFTKDADCRVIETLWREGFGV